MDKLKAMATFVQIAEAGSLSAAARSSGASLPAVVRSLAALEAGLGVRLFNRTTRRIALTDEGRHYLDSCRNLLAALDEAESALRDEAGDLSGQLTLTAPVLFGQMYVAPAVTAFVQHHPGVRCRLLLFDRVTNLLEEGMDVGVRIGHLEDSSLIAHRVGTVRRMVVASPAYLARQGLPAHPKDLLKANCIGFSTGAGPWWAFEDKGRSYTLPVSGNLEFNHVAPAVDACAAGLGFGMFISYQVAHHLADGRLQVVLEDFEAPPRPISVVYPHARLQPARVRAVVEWLREALGRSLDGAPGAFASALREDHSGIEK